MVSIGGMAVTKISKNMSSEAAPFMIMLFMYGQPNQCMIRHLNLSLSNNCTSSSGMYPSIVSQSVTTTTTPKQELFVEKYTRLGFSCMGSLVNVGVIPLEIDLKS